MTIAAMDMLVSLSALLGAACLMTWPFFRSRTAMLAVQLGVGLWFGLHYALLGASTAAFANGLGGTQTLLALLFAGSAKMKWSGYLPLPLMLALAALTWGGWPSLFAALGTVLLAIGRLQTDEKRLRILVVLGTAPWLVHDILIGSPIAIVDGASLLMGCLCLWLPAERRQRLLQAVANLFQQHRRRPLSTTS
jgi:hypothetical protein